MSTENTKKIQRWAEKSGWTIGSHVHQGMFIVSRPEPGGMLGPAQRRWGVAKMERDAKGSRHFKVLDEQADLSTGAKAILGRMLAEKGVSPESAPTLKLRGVKSFPVNVLD